MNGFANAAGYIGAALSVGMVVPQLIRTLRHPSLGGVSAMSWLITAACCSTWLLYGIKGHVWPQIPGNALIVPGAAAIVLAVPARLTVARRAGLLAATAGVLILVAVLAPAGRSRLSGLRAHPDRGLAPGGHVGAAAPG